MKVISSWQHRKKIRPNKRKLNKLIIEIANLANLELNQDETISVNFVGPRIMRRINRDFLNHDYLTDVICFNYKDDSELDDDIAVEIFISPDIAAERAEEELSFTYESELLLYLIHAILHAAGLKDKTEEEKKIMRSEEQRIIKTLKQREGNNEDLLF